jgi:hypothetical protein
VRDHMGRMSDDQPREILGGLPNRRPQRRSEKRKPSTANGSARSAAKPRPRARTEPLRQPKQPAGAPPKPASRRPAPPSGPQVVSTVVQAAAELIEIGVSASARAVRDAISRLPRP